VLLELRRLGTLNLLPADTDVAHATVSLALSADTYVLSNSEQLHVLVAQSVISEQWRLAHVLRFFTITLPDTQPCGECERARLHWKSSCRVEEGTGFISSPDGRPVDPLSSASIRTAVQGCSLSCMGTVLLNNVALPAPAAAGPLPAAAAASNGTSSNGAPSTPRSAQSSRKRKNSGTPQRAQSASKKQTRRGSSSQKGAKTRASR